MAQEEIKYTIPSDGKGATGRQVDLIVTYDPSKQNPDGSYTITAASGSYDTLDNKGHIVDSDTITGLALSGSYGFNDNELFLVADPTTAPLVDFGGITFTISNNKDSNDGAGDVNFFKSGPSTAPRYAENGANPSHASSISVACFDSGTLIATDRGSVAVEGLAVGDTVITSSGLPRAVRWLGHRTIDCRRHRRPHEAMPVRIRAHAFGPDKPARDLRVSPGHAIAVDALGEVLISAGRLVNGTTIIQEDIETATYWHVELDSHDILIAENLPAESYLDMGNRGFFEGADVVELAAPVDAACAMRQVQTGFCRRFVDGGPLLEAVSVRLATRAARLAAQADVIAA